MTSITKQGAVVRAYYGALSRLAAAGNGAAYIDSQEGGDDPKWSARLACAGFAETLARKATSAALKDVAITFGMTRGRVRDILQESLDHFGIDEDHLYGKNFCRAYRFALTALRLEAGILESLAQEEPS